MKFTFMIVLLINVRCILPVNENLSHIFFPSHSIESFTVFCRRKRKVVKSVTGNKDEFFTTLTSPPYFKITSFPPCMRAFCFYTATSSPFTASLYSVVVTQPLNTEPASESEVFNSQKNETILIRRLCILVCGSQLLLNVNFKSEVNNPDTIILFWPEGGSVPNSSED